MSEVNVNVVAGVHAFDPESCSACAETEAQLALGPCVSCRQFRDKHGRWPLEIPPGMRGAGAGVPIRCERSPLTCAGIRPIRLQHQMTVVSG